MSVEKIERGKPSSQDLISNLFAGKRPCLPFANLLIKTVENRMKLPGIFPFWKPILKKQSRWY